LNHPPELSEVLAALKLKHIVFLDARAKKMYPHILADRNLTPKLAVLQHGSKESLKLHKLQGISCRRNV
jgi:hypothetical protein